MEMMLRNFRIRYKKTYIGFLWTLLVPMIQMIVINIVFSFFIDRQDYYLFLFSGLLGWQFFTSSIYSMTSSLVNHRALIKKTAFPREIIPLSELALHFIFFLVTYLLFFFYCAFVVGTSIWVLFLSVFPGIVWIAAFAGGLGLLTAGLNVKYRDIQYLVNASFIPWFYATPILYGSTDLPEHILNIVTLNPLFSAFSLLQTATNSSLVLSTPYFWINIATTVVIILVGIVTFNKKQAFFVDHI